MAALTEILDAMGQALKAVYDGQEIQVYPRLNKNPSGPVSIDMYPADPGSDSTGQGFGEPSGAVFFTVRARVTTGDNQASQDALLNLMDAETEPSLAATLMADQTLDGNASSIMVEGPTGYVRYEDGDAALLGCQWKATVLR